jgi:hypothetical protein
MSGARLEQKNTAWPNIKAGETMSFDVGDDLESVGSTEMELEALLAQVRAKKTQLEEETGGRTGFPLRGMTADKK